MKEKTEIRVLLDQEQIKTLDNLKELFSCVNRGQTIKVLIKKVGKEIYEGK